MAAEYSDFEKLMIEFEEKIFPNTITKVVDVGDCYVVCVCGIDGLPPLHMPYAVSKNGDVSGYNLLDKEKERKFLNGKVLYEDYAPLKFKPFDTDMPKGGNE